MQKNYSWKDYYSVVAPSTIDERCAIRPTKAQGVYIWEGEKRYIDFDGSVATVPLGHGHPLVTDLIIEQLRTVDSVEGSARPPKFFLNVHKHDFEISAEALAQKLCRLTFGDIDARAIYDATGALIVDAAVMFLLTQNPERHRFISFEGNFHGRRGYARDLTCSKPEYKKHYPSSGIQVLYLPFPKTDEHVKMILQTLERWPLEEFNGIFVEAIQGEGGIECWNKKYWRKLAPIFKENKIAVVADEIQCGMWRTGNTWGFQSVGIEPDIVLIGKGVTNGHPVGIAVYKRELEKRELRNGWHAGTFPGHPTMLAAGIGTLAAFEDSLFRANIKKYGQYLSERLAFAVPKKNHYEKTHCVIKGMGLMQGIEFRNADDMPDANARDRALRIMKEHDIITLPCGHNNINPTIRLLPPYCIEKEHIDILTNCLHEIFK